MDEDPLLQKLATALSHDVRGPIRLVTSFLQLVEDKMDLPSDAQELFDYAKASASDAELALESPVDYLRITRDLAPEEFMLSDVCPWEVPAVRITADKRAFARLIEELAANMKAWGKPPMTVTAEGDPLRLRFKHAGEPIPEKFAEQAFAMFRTLQPRDPGQPFGFGLPLVRRIAEAHGGTAQWADGAIEVTVPSGTVI